MIIDVHTHPPRFRERVPDHIHIEAPPWRPDKAVTTGLTWPEYNQAMVVVDRALAFGIAQYLPAPDDASSLANAGIRLKIERPKKVS